MRDAKTFLRSRLVAVLLVSLVIALPGQPADADFSLTANTTYTSTWSYAHPTTLCAPGTYPCYVHIISQTDLSFGSGSQICRDGGGTPLYRLSLNPTSYYVTMQFLMSGGSYAFYQQYVTPGDYYSLGPFEVVNDNDSDGTPGPRYDYEIDWSPDVVRGRNITLNYAYGLAYGPNCVSDPWTTATNISSRTSRTEVEL